MLGSEKWASQSMIDEHGCQAALWGNLDFKTEGWCWLRKYLYMLDVCLSHTYTGIVQLNPGKYLVYLLILLPLPLSGQESLRGSHASGQSYLAFIMAPRERVSPIPHSGWPHEQQLLSARGMRQLDPFGPDARFWFASFAELSPIRMTSWKVWQLPWLQDLGRAQCSLEGDFMLLGDAGRPPLSAFSLPYG